MFSYLFILSRSDEGDLIKIVVGVVFAALWGLGALISSWNKKVEEQRKRRQSGQLPRDVRPPTAYQPQYPYPVPPPTPPAAPVRQRKRRRPAVAPAPPPPPEQVPEKPVPVSATASPIQAQAPQQRHELSESGRIARLVLRKDSLRAALILQEVLSPPVSLREH